jgi:hypothetical protein
VRPEITKQFGEQLCKQGTRVTFVMLNGVTHTFAAKDSVGQVPGLDRRSFPRSAGAFGLRID